MLLSLVIPVHNEEKAIPFLLAALAEVRRRLDCACQVIFVNDGSSDGSLDLLLAAARLDPRLAVVSFVRNFGHQAAITAGMDLASGDAVVVMDADLQDPPELLLEMVAKYREGYDVVSPQRIRREGESFFKRTTARMFYWVMRTMVDPRLLPEVGDFRLFSREALTAILRFREQHRFMRGLVAWLGFKEAVVPFERHGRVAGESKYPLRKMLNFAWTAISSFSALPLRLTMMCGLLSCMAGFGFLLFVVYARFFLPNIIPGWASILIVQCVFSGVTLLAIGVVGEYIAKIYEESKGRPLYVVRETMNIDTAIEPQRAVIIRKRASGAGFEK